MRGIGIAILLISAWSCTPRPRPALQTEVIDLFQEPYQEAFSGSQTIIIDNAYGKFLLSPRATFHITAVAISCRRYSVGWEAALSPIDIAMVWGEMSRADVRLSLRFYHQHRSYSYQVQMLPGIDSAYAASHIANIHVIPGSKAIHRALKGVGSGDRLLLDGLLVDIFGREGGNEYVWKTSLSRTDAGTGACELLYLQRLQINDAVTQ